MYTTIPVSFIDPATGKKLRKVHLCLRHFEICRDNYPPDERRIANHTGEAASCTWCADGLTRQLHQ